MCKLYLLLISAESATKTEKQKKALLPAGVSKSATDTVC
jgi:hypothetical protein